MSPMTALPITRKAVPWNAVKILNMKKDARFGESAVPMLNAVKSVALATDTCVGIISVCRRIFGDSGAVSVC